MMTRLVIFFSWIALLMLGEVLFPRRREAPRRIKRWLNSFLLIGCGQLVVKYGLPLSTIMFAELVSSKGLGLFHQVSVPYWPTLFISILLLDLLIYGQHVLFHRVPILWRLHRVHHSDDFYDVSTALRFHPIEIYLSIIIKFLAIYIFGISAEAILIFEITLNSTAMFNHANIHLPKKLDAFLRTFLVTPDFHRVHHSVIPKETHSNFGFNLTFWDYLFKTYVGIPYEKQQDIKIGQNEFNHPDLHRLDHLLTQPFRKITKGY